MRTERSSTFAIKRSNGKLTGLGQLALGCAEVNLACPWFIISTRLKDDQGDKFDQHLLSWNVERLAKLLEVLEDQEEERRVYVVSATAGDPGHGMRIDRLREIWRATDAKYPSISTIIYILHDGDQYIRQNDCEEPAESLGASRLLLRV